MHADKLKIQRPNDSNIEYVYQFQYQFETHIFFINTILWLISSLRMILISPKNYFSIQ